MAVLATSTVQEACRSVVSAWLSLLGAAVLVWGDPTVAAAQSSASFVLRGAALNAGGGLSTSASYRLDGRLLPDPVTGGRSTSASFILDAGGGGGPPEVCGNGVKTAGEACDDGNVAAGDCCAADCGSVAPAGASCGSTSGSECSAPDSCDGAGACLANHVATGTPAPAACDDGLDCTQDQCDGSGGCQHPPATAGTACGSPADSECTNPDTCDAAGSCLPNNASAGTPAPAQCDDSNACTTDRCNGTGGCQYVNAAAGTPCGSATDTECTNPDTCNGSGTCLANHAAPATPCGDGSVTDCTLADRCDGAGNCSENNRPAGTVCDDGSACTTNDSCGPNGECDAGDVEVCDDSNICTQDSCDPVGGGCVFDARPVDGCRQAGNSALQFSLGNGGKAKWKWQRGQQTVCDEFGDPLVEEEFEICVYDQTGPDDYALATKFVIPPTPLWEQKSGLCRWSLTDATSSIDGIRSFALNFQEPEETEDRSSVVLGAGGSMAPLPAPVVPATTGDKGRFFEMNPSVVVQMRSSTNADLCWGSEFNESFRNFGTKFKTKRKIQVVP